MPQRLHHQLPGDLASGCQSTSPLKFFRQHAFVVGEQMCVARLQRPRHLGRDHTYPDVDGRSNPKNRRADVRPQHVNI